MVLAMAPISTSRSMQLSRGLVSSYVPLPLLTPGSLSQSPPTYFPNQSCHMVFSPKAVQGFPRPHLPHSFLSVSSSYHNKLCPFAHHPKWFCHQRASQIRSMPFTGDSSDSSDGEEYLEASGNHRAGKTMARY